MPDSPTTVHGVMEGDGAYNRHARIQARGAGVALGLLEDAVGLIDLGPADQPIVIADYGSSQGKNSLAPLAAAIQKFRLRAGPDRPILVYHVDLPANDFNSLFSVLDSDPDRYGTDDGQVFPCAVGKSFYESVLPSDYVHVGWSSYAAVWLSRLPALIPDHLVVLRSSGAVRSAFERQAAQDWETFLALRARAQRPARSRTSWNGRRRSNGV